MALVVVLPQSVAMTTLRSALILDSCKCVQDVIDASAFFDESHESIVVLATEKDVDEWGHEGQELAPEKSVGTRRLENGDGRSGQIPVDDKPRKTFCQRFFFRCNRLLGGIHSKSVGHPPAPFRPANVHVLLPGINGFLWFCRVLRD